MYQLHIANKNYSSWSLRPWLLMRELGIDVEEQLTPFDTGSSWATFRAFSPSGRVPCLIDGGLAVWDSLAIVEYLAERHPGVWPASANARAWARSACAEMHSGFNALRSECPMNCGLRVRVTSPSTPLQHDLARLEELWQQGLETFGGAFLAGDAFTAVDAFFAPVAFRVQGFDLPLGATTGAYVKRLLALPGMQDWYRAALAEPWRDEPHERETLAAGERLADHRHAATP
ncbi:glutathione S-transferase family protein [Halomonas organivorans]|uniref:Glutathione S-transferase n=1 Tax=Halomonas organivorans TaxID=257772 RepID=A0A7W5BW03_9GAMM|nr:glutathione S-transferase family protein [Halomonas organivorans]MBB3140129.1 glutathione S-transferase [Halomonas organivorans]